jgi:preprotein translocase subunit SecD
LKLPTGEDIWVKPDAIITGDMIADAVATEDKFTQLPVIQFRLTDEGRSQFAAATRLNVGKRFAIVVNGTAVSAPIILDPVLGGAGQITGNLTTESANDLVKAILPHRDDLLLTVD